MSTNVVVAVPSPNHLNVRVTVQKQVNSEGKAVWVDDEQDSGHVRVGGAHTFLVYAGRRLIIEEVPASP